MLICALLMNLCTHFWHNSRYVVAGFESIDATTGILNSVTKAIKLFPDNPIAPWAAGLTYGIGGAYMRMAERFHRGVESTEAHTAAIRTRARVTLGYIGTYLLIRKARGDDAAQTMVATFDLVWQLAKLVTGKPLSLDTLLIEQGAMAKS